MQEATTIVADQKEIADLDVNPARPPSAEDAKM